MCVCARACYVRACMCVCDCVCMCVCVCVCVFEKERQGGGIACTRTVSECVCFLYQFFNVMRVNIVLKVMIEWQKVFMSYLILVFL